MKKNLLVFCLFLCSFLQAQEDYYSSPNFGANGMIRLERVMSPSYETSSCKDQMGNYYIGGVNYPTDNVYDGRFVITKIASDGQIDTSFGTNGTLYFQIPNYIIYAVKQMAVQSDGKVILVGKAYHPSTSTGSSDDDDGMICRLTNIGELDLSFNGVGYYMFTDSTQNVVDIFNSVVIQDDGKIVVGGTSQVGFYFDYNARILVCRFNTDGSLDNTFGVNGVKILAENSGIKRIILQQDGKIVFTGSSGGDLTSVNGYIIVGRLEANGDLDLNFGVNGIYKGSYFDGNQFSSDIVQLASGDFMVLGVGCDGHSYDEPTYTTLIQLSNNGILNTSFGTNGYTIYGNSNLTLTGVDLLLLSDSSYLVAGYSSPIGSPPNDATFFEVDKNGVLNSTFGENGLVKMVSNYRQSYLFSIYQEEDSSVVCAGNFSYKDLSSIDLGAFLTKWKKCTPIVSSRTAASCGPLKIGLNYYDTSGVYELIVPGTEASCDTLLTLDLTVSPVPTRVDTIVACSEITWLDGNVYNTSNTTATVNIPNTTGCDSIIKLHLTMLPPLTGYEQIFSCHPITWVDGNTYSTTTFDPTFTYTTVDGCDSIVTLNLYIDPLYGVDEITSCGPITWVDGNTYYSSTNVPSFTYLTADGCDSIVYLSLTIEPIVHSDEIVSCKAITWLDGNVYSNTVYGPHVTYTTASGCDSIVVLNFTYIPSAFYDPITSCKAITWLDGNTYGSSIVGPIYTYTDVSGCDSILILDLTITPAYGYDNIVSCKPITWLDGNTYSTDTFGPTYTYTSAGCDSTVWLSLVIESIYELDEIVSCKPITWVDGNTYSTSTNSPTFTFVTADGCDSVVTLNLTITPILTGVDEIISCKPITWVDGNVYSTSTNSPTFTYVTDNGCDSIVTLNLTITPSLSGVDEIVSCKPITWVDGNVYSTSTNSPTFTYLTAHGCDSVVSLNLTITPSLSGVDEIVSCKPITWVDGNIYSTSTNSPTFAYVTADGCDSIVTLNLTITPSLSGIDAIISCKPITWVDGNTYSTSTNSPTFTYVTADGCDSIVTLNLTITPILTGTNTIVSCSPVTWVDGNTYSTSTTSPTFTYQTSSGCDSVVSLNLTIKNAPNVVLNLNANNELVAVSNASSFKWLNDCNPTLPISGATGSVYVPLTNGQYSVIAIASGHGCSDTSDCVEVKTISLSAIVEINGVSIYPNPTSDIVSIESKSLIHSVACYDIHGKLLFSKYGNENTMKFSLADFPSGLYWFEIDDDLISRYLISKN